MYATPVKFAGAGLEPAGDAFGDPTVPPVLFLHGGGQSPGAARGAARGIAQQGVDDVTFDPRGDGAGHRPQDGDDPTEARAA